MNAAARILTTLLAWLGTAMTVASGLLYAWTGDPRWGWTILVLFSASLVLWLAVAAVRDWLSY